MGPRHGGSDTARSVDTDACLREVADALREREALDPGGRGLLVAVAGCAGQSQPGGTTPSAQPSLTLEEAQAALLREEDLPAGWTTDSENVIYEFSMAGEEASPAEYLYLFAPDEGDEPLYEASIQLYPPDDDETGYLRIVEVAVGNNAVRMVSTRFVPADEPAPATAEAALGSTDQQVADLLTTALDKLAQVAA